MVKVLQFRNNDLCAQEAAQQTFVMMLRIHRDMAGMMMASLTLVAVDGLSKLLP